MLERYLSAVKVDNISLLAKSLIDFNEGNITLYTLTNKSINKHLTQGKLLTTKILKSSKN